MACLCRHPNLRTIVKACTLLMFILCSAGLTRALDGDKNIDQYGHDTWTSQNGLPGEAVYQILQTPDGYLWLRTSAGLVRFDGVRFVLVDPAVSGKPVREPVGAMCMSAGGDLLVRTITRTLIYRNGVFTDYMPSAALPDGSIRVVFESREHDVYIGADDQVYVIQNGAPRLLQRGTGWIYAFLEDSGGTVWVGSASGLYNNRDGYFTLLKGLTHGFRTTSIAEDREHRLWVTTIGGLFRLTPDKHALEPMAQRLIHNEANALMEDKAGSYWVGTSADGLFRLSGKQVSSVTPSDGLTDNKILSLFEDREGSLWVGTAGGLDRFHDTALTTFTTKEGLPANQTVLAAGTRDGSLYVFSAGGGLARVKNGAVTAITPKDGLPSAYANGLFESRDGSLWIGTTAGLSRYKDGRFTTSTGSGRFSKAYISAINEDEESLIVTTSEMATFRFKNGKVYPFTFEGHSTPISSPGSTYTFAIYRDPSGTLWFATVQGLFRFAKGIVPEHARRSQISVPVTSITDDHRGNLWLTTRAPGLVRFRIQDGKVTHYGKQNGLFDDVATRVLIDGDGNVWTSTANGIYKTSLQDLDDFADGRITSVRATRYGTDEGMKTSEASPAAQQPAGWQTQDGRLWFTTQKGIVVVDPKHLLHNDLVPPVEIESVAADGKTLKPGKILDVPPGISRIEIRYTGLSLAVPGRVRFKFKLEGYDRDWVDAGSRRVAYYTNLSPGEYHFRVIASNNDGVWNLQGATVGLLLKPHFYQTYWFFTCAGLLIAGLVVLAYQVRTASLRAQQKKLELRVAERTAELKQAEEKYRGIFEEAIVGIFQTAPDGRFLSVNPALARMLGYDSPEDMLRSLRGDVNNLYVVPVLRQEFLRLMKEHGVVEKFEFQVYGRDGRKIWISENARAICDPDGAVLYYVGSMEDVSERKRAEEALLAERQLLRTLIDNMPDYIYVKDPDSRFLLANRHVAEAMGLKGPEDLIGKTDFDFFSKELASAYFSDEQAVIQSGHALVNHEEKTTDAAGNERWLLTTKVPLRDYTGKVVGIVGMGHDITFRKEEERETQKAREVAEAANRAKSEFLANMSHEIRTPLNGIVGMTDLALDTQLTPEQQEYLETVKLSADTLLTVINDILDFSKIEAGKLDLDAGDFDLRDSLESAVKTVAVRADEKGLELLCDVAPDVPEQVRGDSTRLRQVLLNLVGNAIKFTERGEVTVGVRVEALEGNEYLLGFTVADTGIGIPYEKQKLIFQPFSQADSTTTRKYGGTGLGLTISMRLVEMMGGKIWVESELGHGAQFHFTLRLGVAEAKAAQAAGVSPEIVRGVKVLVVDDNGTSRRILTGMLQRWGANPVSVEGGEEALVELSLAREAGQAYEMVLTDMHMPGMDGLTLIKRIRETPKLAAATIIMLTSAGRPGDAQRCLELGAVAYLLKPIRQAELREAIAKALVASGPEKATRTIAPRPPEDVREPASVLRVLLAEDNAVNQRLVMRLLEKRGHQVVLAANGREALEAIEKEGFDLVLMDVQMPEMDGFEATAALRQKERSCGTHLPVIALTAHAMKGDRERCLAAGMDGYLAKPINTEELDHLLHKFAPRRESPRDARALHPETAT
ncbi:MAG TPA: response regulator [Candidatus Dormibacteraeota bacterium]|nr:response regulator [Candidatus Dormibacteraeota bacterium]